VLLIVTTLSCGSLNGKDGKTQSNQEPQFIEPPVSVAFDCTSQEKAAHGHVVHAVQEVPFWAPFDAVFDTSCPGNERCAVDSVSCRRKVLGGDRRCKIHMFLV
jgi:hypothetical protein